MNTVRQCRARGLIAFVAIAGALWASTSAARAQATTLDHSTGVLGAVQEILPVGLANGVPHAPSALSGIPAHHSHPSGAPPTRKPTLLKKIHLSTAGARLHFRWLETAVAVSPDAHCRVETFYVPPGTDDPNDNETSDDPNDDDDDGWDDLPGVDDVDQPAIVWSPIVVTYLIVPASPSVDATVVLSLPFRTLKRLRC